MSSQRALRRRPRSRRPRRHRHRPRRLPRARARDTTTSTDRASTATDRETTVAEPAAGVTLADGRYRLVERLGGGGMATVWMAQDTRLRRAVAVKVISEALAAQAAYVERFRREARIAAGLSHPNLVDVYDFGSDGERPFLVMEYIDGGALGSGSAGATSPRVDTDALARELLDALGHIHAA